ncbi:MAG: hypothetical protein AAGA57_08075 [Planctomycetota bacterium]
MLIDLRDARNRPVLRLDVDLDRPPTLVRIAARSATADAPPDATPPPEKTLSLDWDRALDDAGSLRRCPICGGEHLYRRRVVPRVTLFLIVALGGAAGLMLAHSGLTYAGVTLAAVIAAADLWVLLRFRPVLRCYRCGATYQGVPLRPRHKPWDPTTAKSAGRVQPPWLDPADTPAD